MAKEKIKKKNLRNNSFKSSVSARSTFPLYTRKPQRILTLTLSLVAPALCTKSIDTPCLSGVEEQVFCPSPCKKGYRFNTYCRSRGLKRNSFWNQEAEKKLRNFPILSIRKAGKRYVVDVLTDAQIYSDHAGKSVIDSDDVKLAIQSKVNFSFSQPPPREVLLELARNRNKTPLPKSIAGPGIPLPPEQHTLISPNYQFAITKKQSKEAVEETEDDEEAADPNLNPSQEQRIDASLGAAQRVSFPIGPKRSK
ncbi:uncharacterized protein [Coffea arabica]|uniref:Uncharacterized protein n=1 Tax=Coffea arabica TaxID=13443 RepID=A0ABM4WMN7_COFAR